MYFPSYEAKRNGLRGARVRCVHCTMFLFGSDAIEDDGKYYHPSCFRRNQNEKKENAARTIIRLVHSAEIVSGPVPKREAA
ncbi:MAG: hypothetical protein HYV45_03325 [Candidatus Moranbacteria bacterium]|nr:hypothetical protein [Candidatus Moranbacteria bacterium]